MDVHPVVVVLGMSVALFLVYGAAIWLGMAVLDFIARRRRQANVYDLRAEVAKRRGR